MKENEDFEPVVRTRRCDKCGKLMYLTRSQTNKKYCSVECRKKATGKKTTERDSLGYYQQKKVKYIDPDTGIKIYESDSKLDILATEAKLAGTSYGKLTSKDYMPIVEPSSDFLAKEHKEKEYSKPTFVWKETKKKK